MPKRFPLWLGAIGVLLMVPKTLWVWESGSRLRDGDARIALQPFKRIHFERIDQQPISVAIRVPNTTEWTKIRNVWGQPEFVISAVDSSGISTLCLATCARAELADSKGRIIPLEPGNPPYGYSGSDGLRFHAPPGIELTLKLAGTIPGTDLTGDLIVVSDWADTKDKLVGLSLDKSIESLVDLLSVPGFLFVVAGAGVYFLHRVRHRAVD